VAEWIQSDWSSLESIDWVFWWPVLAHYAEFGLWWPKIFRGAECALWWLELPGWWLRVEGLALRWSEWSRGSAYALKALSVAEALYSPFGNRSSPMAQGWPLDNQSRNTKPLLAPRWLMRSRGTWLVHRWPKWPESTGPAFWWSAWSVELGPGP
jgi:hypothetical protein